MEGHSCSLGFGSLNGSPGLVRKQRVTHGDTQGQGSIKNVKVSVWILVPNSLCDIFSLGSLGHQGHTFLRLLGPLQPGQATVIHYQHTPGPRVTP